MISGCANTKPATFGDGGDTDSGLTSAGVGTNPDEEYYTPGDATIAGGIGSDGYLHCQVTADPDRVDDLYDQSLWFLVVNGYAKTVDGVTYSSVRPPGPATVDNWFSRSGACGISYQAGTAGGGDGGWVVSPAATTSPEDSLYACHTYLCGEGEPEACTGRYQWEVVIDLAQGQYSCLDLVPMRYFFNGRETPAGKTASGAECTAGSGRFALQPHHANDSDKDGVNHAVAWPWMLSGSGVMTRGAWITSVSLVSAPTGATVRLITTTSSFHFNAGDALVDASAVSVVVSGRRSFAPGALRGSPKFTLEGVADSVIDDARVDMSWTCGAPADDMPLPQGYQFALQDIGCALPQRMTIRYWDGPPARVTIEQYGNPGARWVEPTQTTTAGMAFVYDHGGLSFDGILSNMTPNGATLVVNDVSWAGTQICAPGTYALAPE